MQLTTPQLYALAVMAVLIVALIGISYVSGLRTGQAAAQRTAQKTREHYVELYDQEKAAHRTTLTDLDIARNGHWQALEQTNLARAENKKALESITSQANELTIIQRALDRMDGLVEKLLAKALTGEDLLTLKLAARQLAIAAKAHTRSGSNKPNQAELAQQALKEIIGRVSAAVDEVTHPDTDLINWLQKHGTFTSGVATAHIRFPFLPIELGAKSFRDLIKHAKSVTPTEPARDEDGYLIPAPIDYIGDGKGTWQRIDEEQRASGLPAAQCL
ncbi:hypothetical protein [Pseudomonas sp. MGal98]|uniref:hypothetical protein n=1 Tax=Pseudomonas sp. MGal98 TaxID=3162460 RepID=UPI0032ED1335